MPAYQYQQADVVALTAAFSQERLNTYIRHVRLANANATDEDALDLYVWNLQVSAAFQAPLHVLEVCLRNAMHTNLALGFRVDWIDDPGFILACVQAQYPALQPGQKFSRSGPDLLRDIHRVRNRLATALAKKSARAARTGQTTKASVTVNDVVAGLDFGFWTTMLDSRFEQTLWRTILYHAFPNYTIVTGLPISRHEIEKRFNTLRDLRNRVMHHEPLFNRNLQTDFGNISEAISWISDSVPQWVDHHSQWPLIQARQGNRPETF